jgi:hypothetical protein
VSRRDGELSGAGGVEVGVPAGQAGAVAGHQVPFPGGCRARRPAQHHLLTERRGAVDRQGVLLDGESGVPGLAVG